MQRRKSHKTPSSETLETLRSCEADIGEKCGSPLTGYFYRNHITFSDYRSFTVQYLFSFQTGTIHNNSDQKCDEEGRT